MKKALLILCFSVIGCSSPKYIEKTSETLSRSVYASGDSLDLGRVELAKFYNNEAQKLIPPPKVRIAVSPVISNSKKVITLPESYEGATVVTINSDEYKGLLKDKKVAQQLSSENSQLSAHIQEVEAERGKQDEIHSQLLKDYMQAQIVIATKDKKLAQKSLIIVLLSIVILGFILGTAASIYFKVISFGRIL